MVLHHARRAAARRWPVEALPLPVFGQAHHPVPGAFPHRSETIRAPLFFVRSMHTWALHLPSGYILHKGCGAEPDLSVWRADGSSPARYQAYYAYPVVAPSLPTGRVTTFAWSRVILWSSALTPPFPLLVRCQATRSLFRGLSLVGAGTLPSGPLPLSGSAWIGAGPAPSLARLPVPEGLLCPPSRLPRCGRAGPDPDTEVGPSLS